MPRPIVARAAVTHEESEFLGSIFARAYPVCMTHCFGDLLRTMEEADREAGQKHDVELTRHSCG